MAIFTRLSEVYNEVVALSFQEDLSTSAFESLKDKWQTAGTRPMAYFLKAFKCRKTEKDAPALLPSASLNLFRDIPCLPKMEQRGIGNMSVGCFSMSLFLLSILLWAMRASGPDL